MNIPIKQQLDYVRNRVTTNLQMESWSDPDVEYVEVGETFTSPWTQAQEVVLTLKDEDDQSIGRVRVTISVA